MGLQVGSPDLNGAPPGPWEHEPVADRQEAGCGVGNRRTFLSRHRLGDVAGILASLIVTVALEANCSGRNSQSFTQSPEGHATEATNVPDPIAGSFIRFTRNLAEAIRNGDASFITSRMASQSVICGDADVPHRLGGPACSQVGETFQGFGVGRWRSEGGIVPVEGVMEQLRRFVAEARASAKDAYGSGAATVYAIDIESDRKVAILTAIVTPPPGAGGDALRWRLGQTGPWLMMNGA